MSRARVADSRQPPFVIGEHVVAAGSRQQLELRVARLAPGMWTGIPLVVLHGSRPGPTIWVSGAIHGDELNGIPIVRELIARIDPAHLTGTVLAVPIVNIFGVAIGSRYLPDRRDLNRSFPGSPRGSLAARLAHTFFDGIVSRCQLGIDFHTGSGGRANLPQIRCNLDDEQTRRYAQAFGAPVIKHSAHRAGALRTVASERGIVVLLYEAGEAERFERRAISLGVEGTLRVMAKAGMLERAEPSTVRPLTSRASSWVRAPRSGFCIMDVRLGNRVEAGQTLGVIIDSLSAKQVPFRARNAGLVIGVLRTATVHQGDGVAHIAAIDE